MLSLTRSLILNGNVVTTLTKAKATRPYVERLITVSKEDSVANRRSTAAKTGNDAKVIAKLYKELGDLYSKVDETDDARQSYETALELDPKDEITRKKLQALEK